jgi:hypothetical protein
MEDSTARFVELETHFDQLHVELKRAHDSVLRGLILKRMRKTLDNMWAEHRRSSPIPSTAELDQKEELLKHAG